MQRSNCVSSGSPFSPTSTTDPIAADNGVVLEQHREYLHLLAEAGLDRRLRGKVDSSDLVQQTLLQAHQAWARFRGGDGQVAAWLHRILARNLDRCARDFRRARRDIRRERSLEAVLDDHAGPTEVWVAAAGPSPGQEAERAEQLLRVARAVETLPEDQRQAVVLCYWQGRSLDEVAQQLGRSKGAAAALVHRGVKRLRARLTE
jgi:RNA polymerase sigma-70 factor (ECF subfamily)